MPNPPPSSPRNQYPLRSPAGNTSLCTVGRNGNDLHYRGYDILELAANCQFEEVAYLLLYGKLPTQPELDAYKAHWKRLQPLPLLLGTPSLQAGSLKPADSNGASAPGVCLLIPGIRGKRLDGRSTIIPPCK